MDWWKRDNPYGGLEAQATGPSSPTCASTAQATRLVGFSDVTQPLRGEAAKPSDTRPRSAAKRRRSTVNIAGASNTTVSVN